MANLHESLMVSTMRDKRKRLLASLEISKRRALADLYYFDKYVLGYHDMVEHVHQKLCTFTRREIPRGKGEQTCKLILIPRGCFKSCCITIGYTLWRLINNPNLTVLITNEKLENSKAFMREIKAHLTDNEIFKTLFGEWSCEKKMGRKWSETKIDISPRKLIDKSPSVEVSSVESSETSKHVDLLICDDLVGESNITTMEQIKKVIDYHKNLGCVLKPGGEEIDIGTIWDYRDLYAHIQDMKKQLGDLSRTEVMIEGAYNKDGTLYFPEILSKQFLEAQRIKFGTYFFSCQYLNTPVSREDALINRIDKYGDEISGIPADEFFLQCNHFVTVDLAYTEEKYSDSTAIVVRAVNPRTGKRYVRYYRKFKTTKPQAVIDELFMVDDKYSPIRYGIEKNNYTSWLKLPLEEAMRKRGKYLPIDPPEGLPHYGKQGVGKNARLRKLPPVYNVGDCLIHESMTELEDELRLLTYDGVKGHDDLIDAEAMQEEIIFWGNASPTNRYDNDETEAKNQAEEATIPDKRKKFKTDWERLYGGIEEEMVANW